MMSKVFLERFMQYEQLSMAPSTHCTHLKWPRQLRTALLIVCLGEWKLLEALVDGELESFGTALTTVSRAYSFSSHYDSYSCI